MSEIEEHERRLAVLKKKYGIESSDEGDTSFLSQCPKIDDVEGRVSNKRGGGDRSRDAI